MLVRPDISDPDVRRSLQPRTAPYFILLSYCRHVGLQKQSVSCGNWIARVRNRDGGYKQHRLGSTAQMRFEEAVRYAEDWFARPEIARIAAESYQLGSKRSLSVCPIGSVPTVASAMKNYLEWKAIAATRSHFETLVSLINYYIVPNLAFIPLEEFNGKHFGDFCLQVIETPPKRGREDPRTRSKLRELSQEALRKRKKTLNALVSILRGAFLLAWERGDLESDKPIRCLRRLPNVDRPRVVFLSRQQCQRLLDACSVDLRTLVQAALYTGCRANELCKMRVEDFDASGSAVFVSSLKGVRQRYVFLPQEGLRFFQSIAGNRRPSEILFRKANGRIWGAEYKSHFQKARGLSGLSDVVTFHGLRHTYASQLIQGGASLLTVAEQLGHRNVQTVSTTYGHLCADQRKEEVCRSFDSLQCHSANNAKAQARNSVPVFKHCPDTSWPLSNHARFSAPLLSRLLLANQVERFPKSAISVCRVTITAPTQASLV